MKATIIALGNRVGILQIPGWDPMKSHLRFSKWISKNLRWNIIKPRQGFYKIPSGTLQNPNSYPQKCQLNFYKNKNSTKFQLRVYKFPTGIIQNPNWDTTKSQVGVYKILYGTLEKPD